MSDAGLYVRFDLKAVPDKKGSEEAGRPVFKDVEYVEIHVPGDKHNVPHRPVTPEDRVRFKPVYDAWKAGQKEVLVGQPLKEWAAIRPSEVAMLAHYDIHTVEALAGVSDGNISRIGPIRHLVAKAKDHVEASKAAAPALALKARADAQQTQIAALEEQLKQAMALLDKKMKGRPEPEAKAP